MVGGWRLVAAGGWWRLVGVGSWQLAVGGPLGRSLRAVLKKKKPRFLKDLPGGRCWRSGAEEAEDCDEGPASLDSDGAGDTRDPPERWGPKGLTGDALEREGTS